uniref:potassium voltage-gated channel subfamily S member 3-like n=1 Tax=Myxine glutinosa TaxID=7769 RepID=UPI0035900F7D
MARGRAPRKQQNNVQRATKAEEHITINVGGFRQRLAPDTLLRFPETRLGRLLGCRTEEAILELCDDYNLASREFYFDRHPGLFRHVLNFYRTGRLHVLEELCAFSFSQEIEYWGLPDVSVASCCSYRYLERLDELAEAACSNERSQETPQPVTKEPLQQQYRWCARQRQHIWELLENPGSSLLAKAYMVVSLGVVLCSIITMCAHSMLDEKREHEELQERGGEEEDPMLGLVEDVCIVWFTSELLARLLSTPNLRKFLLQPLNIIDGVSVLPFYVTLLLRRAAWQNLGRVVQILRLMRIFRILKLARHSTGLRSLGKTLTHSLHEVGLLMLFLSVGIFIFSVLIYSVESGEDEAGLISIPICWWWATITMTTVGYGDTHPVTVSGKILATVCILCGILGVSLPITIIFNKFSKYYQEQQAMDLSNSCEPRPDTPAAVPPSPRFSHCPFEKLLPLHLANLGLAEGPCSYSDEEDSEIFQAEDSFSDSPLPGSPLL